MGIIDEFASKNFSLYAQWCGILSIIFLIVFGILTVASNLIFSILGWVFAFILVFVEVPLCMKCCPTSPKFDTFISGFENPYLRFTLYLVLAIVMFLSTLINKTLLILPAIFLLFTAIFYGIAAIKKQDHVSTRILGGTGVRSVV